jgi:hypothetical protein
MGVEFNPNGPLKYSKLYSINEASFWDKTRPPAIDAQDTDQPYRIKSEDRLDLLAAQAYGRSEYGWIILIRNGMRLYPNDFVPGKLIYLPTLASLRTRGIV